MRPRHNYNGADVTKTRRLNRERSSLSGNSRLLVTDLGAADNFYRVRRHLKIVWMVGTDKAPGSFEYAELTVTVSATETILNIKE